MAIGPTTPPTGQTGVASGWTPAPTLEAVLYQGHYLMQGHQGPSVADVQRLLDLTPDGFYGPMTRNRVETFQRTVQLAPGSDIAGAVGKTTLRMLLHVRRHWLPAPSVAEIRAGSRLLFMGQAGPAVRALQRLLGLPPSAQDGYFGQATQASVVALQQTPGLQPLPGMEGVIGPHFFGSLLKRLGAQRGGITLPQLRAIMPRLPEARATQYLPHLNGAMIEADITTPPRQAAFLAQLAHESGELRFMEELASGDAYEGRKDLGNTQPGDGRRYKGRGPIQLTGRKNYRTAGEALGLRLEENPESAALPEVGFRVAAWYWDSRHLNTLADVNDFVGITRAINGGLNGLEDRQRYHERARQVLGV